MIEVQPLRQRAFNAMLARLHTAVRDIVRFTADASHELRTPVALIRTSAELALRQRSEALVEFTHRGIGLDPADTARLFDRFHRGARASAHAPDGGDGASPDCDDRRGSARVV